MFRIKQSKSLSICARKIMGKMIKWMTDSEYCLRFRLFFFYSGPLSYGWPDTWTTWVMTKILVLTYNQRLELWPRYQLLCFQKFSDTDLTPKEFWKGHYNILSYMGLIEKSWASASKDTEICLYAAARLGRLCGGAWAVSWQPELQPALRNELSSEVKGPLYFSRFSKWILWVFLVLLYCLHIAQLPH